MKDRRSLLKSLAIGSVWSAPIVISTVLPAHAGTTGITPDAVVDFPTGNAVFFNSANSGNGETNLGAAAAGNMGYSLTQFQSGSYLRQNLAPTGVCDLTELDLSMQMNDRTDGTLCPLESTNTFNVEINGVLVGSFSFETVQPYVSSGKPITVGGFYSFSSIAGTGSNSDEYEIRITATSTRCLSGGGSWQWSIMGTIGLFGTAC